VAEVVAEEEARGLPLLSDGEFRRRGPRPGDLGTGPDTSPELDTPSDPDTSPVDEYDFASRLTHRPVKVAIPAPDRVTRAAFSSPEPTHSSLEAALTRTVSDERRCIDELVDAGCRYVQIDSPFHSPFDTARQMALLRGFGTDPLAVVAWSIWASNEVVAGVGSRATTALHICFSRRTTPGGTPAVTPDDPTVERLFADLRHDRLLVDCERGHGFAWLQAVPPGKTVVLGLVPTRPGTTETVDDLLRRIDEASRYLPIEQLAIGPRCGFSAPFETGTVDAAMQWRKLDVCLRTADRVWGAAVTA